MHEEWVKEEDPELKLELRVKEVGDPEAEVAEGYRKVSNSTKCSRISVDNFRN